MTTTLVVVQSEAKTQGDSPSVTTSKCAENTKKMMKTVAPLQKAVLFTAFMKRPFGPIFNPLVSAASSVSPTPVNSCKFLSQLDVFLYYTLEIKCGNEKVSC